MGFLKFLREPVVHFLVLGAVVFALHQFTRNDSRARSQDIHVTTGTVEHLADGFALVWQRLPTAEEQAGLIHEHVREEVYYREALALGLEVNDTVVRRRLRQKMEFLMQGAITLARPTDQQLAAHLERNAARFRRDALLTFRHVYLSPERRGAAIQGDAARVLADLRAAGAADIDATGDPFLLELEFHETPLREIVALFGEAFAQSLPDLPLGEWSGPVTSGYGVHLVQVTARTAAFLPLLAEIRDAVEADWRDTALRAQAERQYQAMLQKYEVRIEPTPAPGG